MTTLAIDGHPWSHPITQAQRHQQDAPAGSTLIYRIERQLRDPGRRVGSADGVRLVHGGDTTVLDGPLAGGRLSGFDQVTVAADGSAHLESSFVVDVGGATVRIDVSAQLAMAAWARPSMLGALAASGSDLPDEDFGIEGTTVVRTTDPRYVHIDGTIARVHGRVNFESGELEMVALSAHPATA